MLVYKRVFTIVIRCFFSIIDIDFSRKWLDFYLQLWTNLVYRLGAKKLGFLNSWAPGTPWDTLLDAVGNWRLASDGKHPTSQSQYLQSFSVLHRNPNRCRISQPSTVYIYNDCNESFCFVEIISLANSGTTCIAFCSSIFRWNAQSHRKLLCPLILCRLFFLQGQLGFFV